MLIECDERGWLPVIQHNQIFDQATGNPRCQRNRDVSFGTGATERTIEVSVIGPFKHSDLLTTSGRSSQPQCGHHSFAAAIAETETVGSGDATYLLRYDSRKSGLWAEVKSGLDLAKQGFLDKR